MANSTASQHPHPFSAFKSSTFRLYFFGQFISVSGLWAQRVAQGWLVYQLTDSATWLGTVHLAAAIPSLFLMPFGGVIADRIPRRTLYFVAQAIEMVFALLLGLLTLSGQIQPAHIALIALLGGVSIALGEPARQSLMADLVGKEALSSGIAINATLINTAGVIGPSIAGILLVSIGAGWCFIFNGVSYLAVLGALSLIPAVQPMQKAESLSFRALLKRTLNELQEGFQFVIRHPIIAPTLFFSIWVNLTGIGPLYPLLPAFVKELRFDSTVYAGLNAAIGMGSVIGGLLCVMLGRWVGQRRLIYGLSIGVSFGLVWLMASSQVIFLWGGCLLLGMGYTIFFVTCNTVIQTATMGKSDEQYRGRVISFWTLIRFGFAPFATFLLSGVAEQIGVRATLGVTGLLCAGVMFGVLGRVARPYLRSA
jgi:MFS family permease